MKPHSGPSPEWNRGGVHRAFWDEGPKQELIRLPSVVSAPPEMRVGAVLLRTELGRRDVFRAARAVLVAVPAMIHLWWLLGHALHGGREAGPQVPPWEDQVEIGRREFLSRAWDSLVPPRTGAPKGDTTIRAPGTIRLHQAPPADGLLALPA